MICSFERVAKASRSSTSESGVMDRFDYNVQIPLAVDYKDLYFDHGGGLGCLLSRDPITEAATGACVQFSASCSHR